MLKINEHSVTIVSDIGKKLTSDRKEKIKNHFKEFEMRFEKEMISLSSTYASIDIIPKMISVTYAKEINIMEFIQDILNIFEYSDKSEMHFDYSVNMDLVDNIGKPFRKFSEQTKILSKFANFKLSTAAIPNSIEYYDLENNILIAVNIGISQNGMKIIVKSMCSELENLTKLQESVRSYIEEKLEPDINKRITEGDKDECESIE